MPQIHQWPPTQTSKVRCLNIIPGKIHPAATQDSRVMAQLQIKVMASKATGNNTALMAVTVSNRHTVVVPLQLLDGAHKSRMNPAFRER
jgi:hypothetical protein